MCKLRQRLTALVGCTFEHFGVRFRKPYRYDVCFLLHTMHRIAIMTFALLQHARKA